MAEESKKLLKKVRILKIVDDDTQEAMCGEITNICARALTKVGRVVNDEHIAHTGVHKVISGLLDLTEDVVDEITTGPKQLKAAETVQQSALVDISNAPLSPEVEAALKKEKVEEPTPKEKKTADVNELQPVQVSPTKVS